MSDGRAPSIGGRTQASGKIRVLHLLSGCTVGGCERHVFSLLSQLDRERYEPWLACFVAEPDRAEPMIPEFRARGVRTVDLRADRRADPRAMWRLGRLMRAGRFDIVHAHSFRTELAAVLWGKLLGWAPIVIRTVHNTDEFYIHPRYAPLARASAARLDRIVVISEAVGRYLREEGGLPGDRMTRIYYGIDAGGWGLGVGGWDTASSPAPNPDPSSPSPQPSSPSPQPLTASRQPPTPNPRPPTLGIIARLAPQKGHRVLLDAMPRVLEHVPSARLRVVGHEELSSQAELRAYAASRGVAASVEFEGFRPDVLALLRELDLLVLPSFWEGFGLVLLEAMAAGRPVVASRVGPIPEVVLDGVTGLLVEPGAPEALARAIVRVLADPALAERLGRAGRARVAEQFGLERMVAETDALYRDLVGRRLARAA